MKRNTIQEMKAILDAIEQGKPVQWYDSATNTWKDFDANQYNPDFNLEHRIKPEEPKKNWRPFKDVDEFIKAAGGLGAIWLKHKTDNQKQLVTSISPDVCTHPIHSGFSWKSYKDLLEEWTFADGTPCGVLIEGDA